ncbi:unnamed protein product [Closterium sp. Yama58-4]|nr:unnamed protein product [Closterium sp. Yama58-4]
MGIRSPNEHASPPSSLPKVFGNLTALVVEPLPAAARKGQRRNDEAGQIDLHPELLREMEALESSLLRHHINPQAAHIQGCRYLCSDPLLLSFSASPPCKVTTLAKDSLAVLNQMRHEADRQQQRREMLMVVQGGGRKRRDALTARVGRGTKVERGCDSLLGAEELVDRLNAQHFGGVFPSH